MQPWGKQDRKIYFDSKQTYNFFFNTTAKKVKLEMSKKINADDLNKLTKQFSTKLEPALETYNTDLKDNG